MDGAFSRSPEVLEVVAPAVIVADADGKICYVNRAGRAIAGRSADLPLWEVLSPTKDAERELRALIVDLLASGGAPHMELPWQKTAQEVRQLDWHFERVGEPGDAPVLVVATGLDVTDHRESEEQFKWLSSATIEGITAHEKGVIFSVNQRCADMFGYTVEEMVGRSVLDFATAESRPVIMDRVRQGLEEPYEVVALCKDGSTFPLEIATRSSMFKGRPLRIAGLRDISVRKRLEAERQEAEERLHRAQRLETVAVLAGGIAHDFNNLLMVILNNAAFALDDPGITEVGREDILQVVEAAERAAKLTGQLLIFSKHQNVVESRPSDVNDILTRLESMMGRSVPSKVRVSLQLGSGVWRVGVGPAHLEQMVLNLVVNAGDALPIGGKVSVRTSNCRLDEPRAVYGRTMEPGDYVLLEVSDNGRGIPADAMAHVFEPFYSTKQTTRNVGLGLAVVHGIVTGAQGGIAVHTSEAGGTTFSLYLPRYPGDNGLAESPERPPSSHTILVVEDQEEILRIMERQLERAGYRVLAAQTSEKAMDIVTGYPGAIRLLVSDVIMPGLSGPELAKELLALHPEMDVLFVSGYPEDILSKHAVAGRHFLSKPFTSATLLGAIEKILSISR